MSPRALRLHAVADAAPQVFFLVPETAYRRDVNTDMASTENLLATGPATKPEQAVAVSTVRATYMQRLALFNGRKTDENLAKLMFRPLPLLAHPAILWGMVTQGKIHRKRWS